MASHPFRTARPTGSPSAGGSIHTLGAHLADNTPHPQFVKKGEEVGGGNISAHEENKQAHLRFYLSRAELCCFLNDNVTISEFNKYTDKNQIAIDDDTGYSVEKLGGYVITPYALKVALANADILGIHFGQILNRSDIVINSNADTKQLADATDDRVPAYSMFDTLASIVANMLYGVTLPNDNLLYGKVSKGNVNNNLLGAVFSKVGHTHDSLYATKEHSHGFTDVVLEGTGVNNIPPVHPAAENHTHSEYVTFDDLKESELTRENLREVGIYEQAVPTPRTYLYNEFDLNRYCTQGNYTFAISRADLSGENGDAIRAGHFPEIYIGAIADGGLSSLSTGNEIDELDTDAILKVTAVQADLINFGKEDITSQIQTGAKSGQFKTVLQILSTNSLVKRNGYSSSLSDKVITYKDLSRKLYSRTGYSLDYAKYISSVIRSIFTDLDLSPESFFTADRDFTPIEYVAARVNSVLGTASNTEAPEGFGIGYIKYNYASPYTECRIRLAPELADLFTTTVSGVKKVPVFEKDQTFSTNLNTNLLSRDVSGWILDGYYKRIVANGSETYGDAAESIDLAKAMMPILGNLYVPYLNYFTTEYAYDAIDTTDSVDANTAYFDDSNNNARITSAFDTSSTVVEDAGDSEGAAYIKLEDGAEASYPPAGFDTTDPYLYEFKKITAAAYTGVKWSDPSGASYAPLYVKTPSANSDIPDTFTEVFGTAGSNVFTELPGQTVSDAAKTYTWDVTEKIFKLWDVNETYDPSEVFYEYTGTVAIAGDIVLYSRCYVTDENGAFKWNKILLDRSVAYNITNTFKVYAYDLSVHRFIDVGNEFLANGNVVPASGSQAFNEWPHEYNLYTDSVINTRSSYFGLIEPEVNQYVIPKILNSTKAILGVDYVKFTGSDVSKFTTDPDYTTGFTSGGTIAQRSFVQCSEDDKSALQVELGIQIEVPTNAVRVRVYEPDKLEYDEDGLSYDDSLVYLRKAQNGTFSKIADLTEIIDSNDNIIPTAIADVYTMPVDETDMIYILPGTTLAGDGTYGVRLKRYAKTLTEVSPNIYTRAFFYKSVDTSLRANKKYYTFDSGTRSFEEITSVAAMTQAVENDSVYETLTMEDFFDIWCAIQQLTTEGSTSTAAVETGSDALVYNFDSNGDLITWDAWQELVTHGDPSFATFESRTGAFLRLTDELLPKLNLVETALESSIDSNGFRYASVSETTPVQGRRYYTKSGSVYTGAGIGGDTLTAFASGTTYWINKYDAALDKAFKHARWLASLTESEATLWLGLGTSTANITLPSITYTENGGITTGAATANSSSGTTIRLKWKSGSTDVALANLADLDKYATGKWVLDLQGRISDLEAADPSRESYTVTYDSIPVNGRKYYTKSGDVYTLAGIGQDTLMSFSSGITYYVSTSLSARMNELEAIWEWFENNVRSGGGSLVVNATTTDVCIDAFLNYDVNGSAITRGTVVNLNPRSPNGGYVLVPTSEVNNGIRVDTNLSGDIVTVNGTSYTRVKVIDVDENGYAPYQFSVILKCDDSVSGSQNKVIENPIAEILIPDANNAGQYQGAVYVPASSLLWTVSSGTNQGIWFKVPQSWVDLYNLGTNNSTYHVYLRKRFYGNSMTVGIARANKLVVNHAGS